MKFSLAFLLISACIIVSVSAQGETLARRPPPPPPPPKPVGNCACGDKVCIKTLLDRIRGALIATVRNMIILISSEHLPLPPPCTGPGRPCHGFKLPNVDDLFKSENCVCDSKHH